MVRAPRGAIQITLTFQPDDLLRVRAVARREQLLVASWAKAVVMKEVVRQEDRYERQDERHERMRLQEDRQVEQRQQDRQSQQQVQQPRRIRYDDGD